MKIAISGKGGVGKTTISSTLALELSREGKQVLAIDADPNGNLAQALGYDAEKQGRIKPLIERRDIIEERTGAKTGDFGGMFVMNPKVDDFIDRFALDIRGLKLMVTGELREALSGCYCPENSVLRSFIGHLFMEREEWVLLDMEAGFEHLTRGTAESVDILLVVVEPGQRAILTAKKINVLADQIGIPKVGFILNKVHGDEQKKTMIEIMSGLNILTTIPFDITAVKADLEGKAHFDECPLIIEAIRELKQILLDLSKSMIKNGKFGRVAVGNQ
jgi:CO dehydrogenase maturation factor|tara:strand:- start:270 stop:1094 length:825 start_codon:yes stop_codon:yes gene_type:complete